MDETAQIKPRIQNSLLEAGHGVDTVEPDTHETPLNLTGDALTTIAAVAGETVKHIVDEAVAGSSPVGTVVSSELNEIRAKRLQEMGG